MAWTDKKAAFVREYPKDFNGTQAAIRAGYSAKTANRAASRLLSDVDIQAELAKLQEEARTESILTLRERQEWWSSIIRDQDPDTRLTDRLRASELLGKSQGDFIERHDHTTKGEKLEPTVSVYLPSNGRDATPD